MLEQLATKHNEILKVAYKITGDLDIAKDVVQDAYIKLYDSGKKFEEINDSYIYFTLKSIYNDSVKQSSIKNRYILTNDFDNVIDDQTDLIKYEIKDLTRWEKLVVDAVCGRIITNRYNIIVKEIDGISMTNLSKKTGINYSIIYRTIKNLKSKVCQKD
jgi:DNA-directed RNA polymerase specialized sigma24 family protein